MDDRFFPELFLENTEREFSVNINHVVGVDNVDGIAYVRLLGDKMPFSRTDSRSHFGPFSDVAEALKKSPVKGLLLIDGVQFEGVDSGGEANNSAPPIITGQSIINFNNISHLHSLAKVRGYTDGVVLYFPGSAGSSGITVEKISYRTLQTLRERSLARTGLSEAPKRNENGDLIVAPFATFPQP